MRACYENYSFWCTEATNLHLWLQTLRALKHTHRQSISKRVNTPWRNTAILHFSIDNGLLRQGEIKTTNNMGIILPYKKQASPTCSCADNDHHTFACSLKMALDCQKNANEIKQPFYSHYISCVLTNKVSPDSCDSGKLSWRMFQWLYLPPLLQRLLAAMWPLGKVHSWFHIILEFLKYDHIHSSNLASKLHHSRICGLE